jgi:hypothetical protein
MQTSGVSPDEAIQIDAAFQNGSRFQRDSIIAFSPGFLQVAEAISLTQENPCSENANP